MSTYMTGGGTVATMTTSGSVSRLARDARKVLGGPVDAMEAHEVLTQIDTLMNEWRDVPDAPIHLWLNNLRRKIESR